MKRRIMSIVMASAMVMSGMTGCGDKKKDTNTLFNKNVTANTDNYNYKSTVQ